jgi:hypothetical protein
LSYFHGPTAASSQYQFGGNLGSSSLSGFARQSAGGPNGQSQVYYLPSSTVSTGGGSLYSAPVGSGFDSAIVPRSSISPTASGAQINSLATGASQSQAITRAMQVAPPEAGSPGAVLSSTVFSLRVPDQTVAGEVPTEINTNIQPNPDMVQGAVNGPRDPRIVSKTDEMKAAMVSDTYMKIIDEMKNQSQGMPGINENAGKEAAGPNLNNEKTGPEIDPLTGMKRQIANVITPPKNTSGLNPPAKVADSSLSAKKLTDLSTAELTAGKNIKPVKMVQPQTTSAAVSEYDMNMARAELNLKASKYLDSAEAYQGALSSKPNDPLALAGRGHAEMGAGVYSAAAYDLKFIFTRKPEMISIHYDPQSFIIATRQEYLLEDLHKLTANKDTANMASFLYCYLCYQTNRTTMLQAELKAWGEREGHDEWQSVVNRAWTAK